MALVEWQDAYSVGHGGVDFAHRQIIDSINELHEAMTRGKASEVLGAIATKLVRYTKGHFAQEEQLMAQIGYPQLEQHKKIHRRLVAQVIELDRRIKAKTAAVGIETMAFLRTWLTDHILKYDQQYARLIPDRPQPAPR